VGGRRYQGLEGLKMVGGLVLSSRSTAVQIVHLVANGPHRSRNTKTGTCQSFEGQWLIIGISDVPLVSCRSDWPHSANKTTVENLYEKVADNKSVVVGLGSGGVVHH